MADTHIYFREVRFLIEKELTQCYVFLDAYVDVPIGIQGWHHKTFPASMSNVDILNATVKDDPMMWPQAAPPAGYKRYRDDDEDVATG